MNVNRRAMQQRLTRPNNWGGEECQRVGICIENPSTTSCLGLPIALPRHSNLSSAVLKLTSSVILLSDDCLSTCFRFMILIVTLARQANIKLHLAYITLSPLSYSTSIAYTLWPCLYCTNTQRGRQTAIRIGSLCYGIGGLKSSCCQTETSVILDSNSFTRCHRVCTFLLVADVYDKNC